MKTRKRLKLKPFVIPTIYTMFAVFVVTALFFSIKLDDNLQEDYTYVSSIILDQYVPVMKNEEIIIKPFNDKNVKIINDYYDYKNENNDDSSIIEHDNMYIQNTGINYGSDTVFDVVSVLSGEVIDVKDTELLGKTITIRHDKDIITIYQSLSETLVKKGDKVTQGQVIGKSGICSLIKDSDNSLHFEIYLNGVYENPNNMFDKNINEI